MEDNIPTGIYWESEDYKTWENLARRSYHCRELPVFTYSDIILPPPEEGSNS